MNTDMVTHMEKLLKLKKREIEKKIISQTDYLVKWFNLSSPLEKRYHFLQRMAFVYASRKRNQSGYIEQDL